MLERLLLEQYDIEEEGLIPSAELKPAKAIRADSLQSPHDEEAAYRKKKDETVRGYSANVTETCDEEGLNLIVDVQVEPATAADNSYLQEAAEKSEAVLDGSVKEVSADGAYYNDNETYARKQEKAIHYTGFPGKPGRYDYERTDAGLLIINRETGEKQLAEEYKEERYRFPVDGQWRYITDKEIQAAECRRQTESLPRSLFNRRCNVEATIFQLCYHTRKKQLKYRGRHSVTVWAICRSAWINMKRIAIYLGKHAEMAAWS